MIVTKPSTRSAREISKDLGEVRAERARIVRRLARATTDADRADAQLGLQLADRYLIRLEEALEDCSHGWERRSRHSTNRGI